MESKASGIVQTLREKSMPNSTRSAYNAEQKVAILRKHLLEHVAVSQLCDEYQLQPTVFYRWQKRFFENGALSFTSTRTRTAPLEQQMALLEEKLRRKNEVIAELMEEQLRLKRALEEG